MSRSVRVECYGSTRPRDGSVANEDAYWIWRPSSIVAAACDGTGPAPHCASQVLRLFARRIEEGRLQVQTFPAWRQWIGDVDHAMRGGPESTFLGIAVVGDRLVGAQAGDTRAFLVNEHGCRILGEAPGGRLGSGDVEPHPLHERITPDDTVLIMTDGAWTPLPLTILHRLVMAARLEHFSDLPATLIDAAGRHGHADDMTVLALRLR